MEPLGEAVGAGGDGVGGGLVFGHRLVGVAAHEEDFGDEADGDGVVLLDEEGDGEGVVHAGAAVAKGGEDKAGGVAGELEAGIGGAVEGEGDVAGGEGGAVFAAEAGAEVEGEVVAVGVVVEGVGEVGLELALGGDDVERAEEHAGDVDGVGDGGVGGVEGVSVVGLGDGDGAEVGGAGEGDGLGVGVVVAREQKNDHAEEGEGEEAFAGGGGECGQSDRGPPFLLVRWRMR